MDMPRPRPDADLVEAPGIDVDENHAAACGTWGCPEAEVTQRVVERAHAASERDSEDAGKAERDQRVSEEAGRELHGGCVAPLTGRCECRRR